jgi:membrane protein required for colicin V production
VVVADWVIIAILVYNALQAARRGIFVEAFALGGIVVGVGVASWNYTRLLPWFSRWIHTTAFAEAAAFLTIVLAVMLLAGLIGRAIRWSVRTIGLGWADRFLGALFGLLKGAVVVTLAAMLLVAFWPGARILHGSRQHCGYACGAAGKGDLRRPAALGASARRHALGARAVVFYDLL